jgi:hypothetical protein
MSELEDLMAVHGAEDLAIVEDPTLRGPVAQFVGAYEDPDAVGWFDEFRAWNNNRGIEDNFRGLETALENLSATEDAVTPRTAARRILAVKLATIVRPALASGPDPLINNVLAVTGLCEDHSTDLARLIIDPAVFGAMSDWENLLAQASGSGFITSALAVQAQAPPCDGHTVVVPTPGDPSPAVELHTTFTANTISFECACQFLEPSNWTTCSSFWCEMDTNDGFHSPTGNPIYHEIVGFSCPPSSTTWWAETYLEFAFHHTANFARVSYNLSPDHTPADPQIVVDQGWLTVTRTSTGIEVETLKRVKFNHTFTGPMLAAMMCPLGYATAAHDLVFNCAHDCDPTSGTPLPPNEATLRRRTVTRPGPEPSGATGAFVDDAADKVAACIRECADSYLAAYAKIGAGKYTANDLIADASRMWMRSVRDGAAAIDVANRAAAAFRTDLEAEASPPVPGGTPPKGP